MKEQKQKTPVISHAKIEADRDAAFDAFISAMSMNAWISCVTEGDRLLIWQSQRSKRTLPHEATFARFEQTGQTPAHYLTRDNPHAKL